MHSSSLRSFLFFFAWELNAVLAVASFWYSLKGEVLFQGSDTQLSVADLRGTALTRVALGVTTAQSLLL